MAYSLPEVVTRHVPNAPFPIQPIGRRQQPTRSSRIPLGPAEAGMVGTARVQLRERTHPLPTAEHQAGRGCFGWGAK